MPATAAGVYVQPSRLYRSLMERLPIRYADVRRVGGAVGPATFNAAQERLYDAVAPILDSHSRGRFIILKARQQGVSTFFSLLITAISVITANVQSMVVAQDKAATQRIWGMSKLFRDQSPLSAIGKVAGHTLTYGGTSTITLSTAGSPDTARSGQLTCFHGSEVAFWPDPAALVAILQCLPRRRDVFSLGVIESTANGMAEDGALFHQEWLRACKHETSFIPIFLPWHTFPEYADDDNSPLPSLTTDEEMAMRDLGLSWGQIRWRRQVMAEDCQGDIDVFNQEYPATPEMAFIMSGHPFFRPEELLWCEPHIRQGVQGSLEIVHGRITWQPDSRGALTIFRRPEPGHQYIIGADSAMGLEGGRHSKSAAEVFDMDTLEQVAEFDGPAAPHAFAKHLALLGRVYNTALLAPEIQSSGGGGGRELLVYLQQDWGYYHLHRWTRVDRISKGQSTFYGWECVDPDAKILTGDLRWIAAENIQEGDTILACQEYGPGGKGTANRLRMQTVTHRQTFLAPKVEVELDDGRQTRVSETHPFWASRPGDKQYRWIAARDLRPGDILKCLPLWDTLRTYEAGRLSAFLDGEGHLSGNVKHYGFQLMISQAEGPLAEEIHALWGTCGFESVFKWVRHRQRPQEKPIATCGLVRLPEILRALGSLRPSRLLRTFAHANIWQDADSRRLTLRSFASLAVVRVTAIGQGPVIGLTTDPDHTLIADGIVGHNTNSQTRPRMLARLREHVQERSITLHSRALMTQLRCFGENDAGKLEALAGYDDLLMALGIGLISRSENYVAQRPGLPVKQEERVDLERMGYRVQEPVETQELQVLAAILAGQQVAGVAPAQSFMEA